jgi:hypothetical protein
LFFLPFHGVTGMTTCKSNLGNTFSTQKHTSRISYSYINTLLHHSPTYNKRLSTMSHPLGSSQTSPLPRSRSSPSRSRRRSKLGRARAV